MDKVEGDLDSVRAHVFEVKTALQRADRARSQKAVPALPAWRRVLAVVLLALLFLLM